MQPPLTVVVTNTSKFKSPATERDNEMMS